MMKMMMSGGGGSLLPPGFRFEPTEQELVFEYLKCKVFSSALPASIIPDINLCDFDPWDLPRPGDDEAAEDQEMIRYLFCNTEGSKYGISSPSGYWKAATGRSSDMKIVSDHNLDYVGMKKTLFFYNNKLDRRRRRSSNKKTGWVMHQYRLISAVATQTQLSRWVLCCIFCKKLPNKTTNNQFLQSTAPSSSSSNSSCSSTSGSSAHGPVPTSNSHDHFSAS